MPATIPMKPIPLLIKAIEIPDSAYERAEARYNDIGRWLCRSDSSCREFDPVIFPQGSFLIGTVTRRPRGNGEHDLDIACKLQRGVSKSSHTQMALKLIIGAELEAYRRARQIEQELDEKRRCWRLHYRDEMSFHIDALPCLPEDERLQGMIKDAMIANQISEMLAADVADLTVSITDNERSDYERISFEWNVSNPQGFGLWFASRVRLAESVVRDRLRMEKRATVEDLPTYKLKAPLQQCVQLLKVHRDVMFENDSDLQPISIIITTLAARAYAGQEDITEALLHIVHNMGSFIRPDTPRVQNPVNPDEDFADKWDTPEGRKLRLEENFHRWLAQARADFNRLAKTYAADDLKKLAGETLGLNISQKMLERLGGHTVSPVAPAIITPTQRIDSPPMPWASE